MLQHLVQLTMLRCCSIIKCKRLTFCSETIVSQTSNNSATIQASRLGLDAVKTKDITQLNK